MTVEKNRRAMSVLRHGRLRKRLNGTSDQARLAVFRSTKHIYAQLIDDQNGTTLVAANSLQSDVRDECAGKNPTEVAAIVGKHIAEKGVQAGIKKVVFDRGGFKYHGRVKSLADAAREAGLEF